MNTFLQTGHSTAMLLPTQSSVSCSGSISLFMVVESIRDLTFAVISLHCFTLRRFRLIRLSIFRKAKWSNYCFLVLVSASLINAGDGCVCSLFGPGYLGAADLVSV